MPLPRSVDRRAFVQVALGGLCALARPSLRAAQRPAPGPMRTLVLLQLSGGNDGLSTLVPYGDDAYARARRETRIRAEDVLRIDDRVGLHPRLAGLRETYERGRLALIEGVGPPEPSRSHFRALDVWHAADARGRGVGAGWIGRCVERLADAQPHAIVHLGPRPPFALHGAARAALCLTPALRVADPARSRAQPASRALDDPARREGDGDVLSLVRARLHEAQASASRLHEAVERHRSPAAYPPSALARDLRSAAALIHAELGVRVISIELDGFDTHRDQRERLARLLTELDRALHAFLADLEHSEAGREALVFAFSEFGRRVEENASAGTDHGAAGLCLALGAGVRGGLYGRPPALDALQDGDLVFTTDFRAPYATCIERVFGLEPSDVLGADAAALPFA
jgi:uncharacterized protein (DUF1501 family)